MDVTRGSVALALALAGAGAGCSSRSSRVVEDARQPVASGASARSGDAATGSDPGPTAATTGDIAVRVVWRDVPVAARTSPGQTACGTPRAPQVAPTTTWGIPEVLVTLDGGASPGGTARVRYADCAVTPRIVTGSSLVVESADARPARLALRERDGDSARPLQLPVAGHAVAVPLVAGTIYELAPVRGAADSAWIVAGSGAITDRSGGATFRDVPPGTYGVRAWLPPAGSQPAREAQGQVTVGEGELAELTLEL